MYRKSLWDGIGVTPDTWDNIRIGGAKLKAKGNPVGISLGHSNDPNPTWRGLLWSYGGAVQDETGKKVVLNSKETIEAVKFATALYKEAMTTRRPVVERRQQQPVHRFRGQLADHQSDLGLSDGPAAQQEGGRRHFRHEAAEGPGAPDDRMARPNSYGIWKFAKNKEAAIEFLKHYTDNWVEAFKASTGYNMPIFANIVPKPMPLLSDDPTSTPHDKLAILQTSDEWSAATGYPGPAWPATDEIYNNFMLCDMMAKAATGAMSAEEFGQVGHAAMPGHLRQVAAEVLMASAGPDRARSFHAAPGTIAVARGRSGPSASSGRHERRSAGPSGRSAWSMLNSREVQWLRY